MPDPTRLLAIALAATLAMIPAAAGTRADEPTRVRILSYNINHGEGADSRVDLRRIIEAIRSAEPDVVALQEVDRGMVRTGSVDQARLLAGRLGMAHAFGGNLELLGGTFGNAILSRFPIAEARNHRLPSASGGEPRGALEATIAPEGAPPFRVLSTQLDYRRDDRDRRLAAERLAALAELPDAPPAVLAGDLNAGPSEPALEPLAPRWAPTSPHALPTVPAGSPRAQFDHVFLSPPDRWRVVEVRVLDEPLASDHRPILAILELVPGTGASASSP